MLTSKDHIILEDDYNQLKNLKEYGINIRKFKNKFSRLNEYMFEKKDLMQILDKMKATLDLSHSMEHILCAFETIENKIRNEKGFTKVDNELRRALDIITQVSNHKLEIVSTSSLQELLQSLKEKLQKIGLMTNFEHDVFEEQKREIMHKQLNFDYNKH